MKNSLRQLLTFIAMAFFLVLSSQVPQGINYQGVARNSKGLPLVNQSIGLRIVVFDSSNSNTNLYSETHTTLTNAYGLYQLQIGKGAPVSSNFSEINWSLGEKWIRVFIDPNGGSNYSIQGAMQIMSVPYALYAGNMKDSQTLNKTKNSISISNGNSILLNDDDSSNEIQKLSISHDTIRLSKSLATVKLPNPASVMEDLLGCVFVHRFCNTGDGTFTNPWKSLDSSAGIKEALKHLSPNCRILYFKPGYYATTGALEIDFGKLLPNLSDPYWKVAFYGYGIEFQGHNASIYVNGGAPLNMGKPGILFNSKGDHAFYWKFTGMQFYGVVDTALIQWGNTYEFPLNGCEIDIVANNGYVPVNYTTTKSRASAIKICEALESRMHLVAVCASGSAVVLDIATFCTISGAFSNTIIPNTNTIYPNSYGLVLTNCQSNNFTSMDLEIAHTGIKFEQWSIQNTFSAIFVAQGDSTGATFDNSMQVTNGKNVVISIRSASTVQVPSVPIAQKLFTINSDPNKLKIDNYFSY